MRMLRSFAIFGNPVRVLRHLDATYVCLADLIRASNLTGKANPSMLAKRFGARATIRARRSDFADEFGRRGSTEILFAELSALERWVRPFPDEWAAMILQRIRDKFAPMFADETSTTKSQADQNTQAA